ncbi:Stage II sporulation protein E (SpoIIE) [Paraoerskovia marina]|uniref:Stage II sporulation protein E (SpoIIE) n=1 Tax=Paraoerskovia marina TaxID=545619 RepID=A0A1H1M774_9CELL|nr:Stage II sporulation protein E (SpoIIE) [Paraoerskovia marina]
MRTLGKAAVEVNRSENIGPYQFGNDSRVPCATTRAREEFGPAARLTKVADWFERAIAESESNEAARDLDWARTPIGDPSTWPPALRSAVQMCFGTQFPVLVAWGDELTMIYNDAFRMMLGRDLHPRAMGARLADIWGGIWPTMGPRVRDVLKTGRASWDVDLPLRIRRSGFVEETRFTFSLSPLRDADGSVSGIIDIAWETTDVVVDRRRLRTLRTLSTALGSIGDDTRSIPAVTSEVLTASSDLEGAQVYLREPDGTFPAAHPRYTGLVADAVREVAEVALPRWVGTTLVAPLSATPVPAGVIVLDGSSSYPFNDTQRSFLALIAHSVDSALSHGLTHQREVATVQGVSDALQEAIAPGTPDSPRWAVRYRPADHHLSIGGDWYDVVTLDNATYGVVVGDCVGHGLEAAVLMGQLRSAGRALFLADLGPAHTLTDLDAFASTVPGAECTSVFCGIVDTDAGTVTYSSAGHPPGLVVGADGTARWLEDARGAPLTIATRRRTEAVAALSPGDTVILYSDGLVERRGESLREGFARLERYALELVPQHDLASLPDALLAALVPGVAKDDVAIVVYRAGS